MNLFICYRSIQNVYFFMTHFFITLYFSRNLSISSKLSNLLTHNCSFFYSPFYFCKVVFILSFLILVILLFSFVLGQFSEKFINFFDLFKETHLALLIFSNCYFSTSFSLLSLLFPSSCLLKLICSFFQCLKWKVVTDLNSFFFFNMNIYS